MRREVIFRGMVRDSIVVIVIVLRDRVREETGRIVRVEGVIGVNGFPVVLHLHLHFHPLCPLPDSSCPLGLSPSPIVVLGVSVIVMIEVESGRGLVVIEIDGSHQSGGLGGLGRRSGL